MRRLLAAMKKEMLLLIRDRIGLAILFVMPVVLITVMTFIQDAIFRNLNEEGIPAIIVNYDQDTLGNRLEKGLLSADMCDFHTEIDGKTPTEEQVIKAVQEGEFLIGIIVPKGATDAVRDNVSNLVSESLGMDDEEVPVDTAEIKLVIDPIATKSFVTSITSRLREFISGVKAQLLFETFNAQIADLIPDESGVEKQNYDAKQVIKYSEQYASEYTGSATPNAVQHNVPAWTIFAMFLIITSMVASVIREKTEGSVFRFHTIPVSYALQINAKLIVFTIVCLIQFVLMMSIGILLFPLMGLPLLDLGHEYLGIVLMAASTALAATGYGIMVGTLASTQQQGSIFGSLSILLLSAIGGIWVPSYVMSDTMRMISEVSPLHWALEGFYGLFLRGEGIGEIYPQVIKLLVFFLVCIGITVYVYRIKRKV